MKEFTLPIVAGMVLAVFAGIAVYQYGIPETEKYFENQIHGVTIRDVAIDVMLANTHELRERGLSGMNSLGSREGMLFVFDKPDHHAIWMKDMNFAIDIIWIGEDFTVVDIAEAVTPETFPSIFEPRTPARMALEVNSRFVATYGIKRGDAVLIAPEYLPTDLTR